VNANDRLSPNGALRHAKVASQEIDHPRVVRLYGRTVPRALVACAISAILPSFGLCATIARLCAFMKGGKFVNFELSRMVTSARFPKRSRSDGSQLAVR
jgi:hypothetical protein